MAAPWGRQFYVEVLVDASHALRGPGSGGPPEPPALAGPGLDDLVQFLCKHFNDARIINPDIREALLKSIAAMMQSAVSTTSRPSSPFAAHPMASLQNPSYDLRRPHL